MSNNGFKSKAELAKELEEQRALNAQLLKQLESGGENDSANIHEDGKIDLTDYISVMSLCPNRLNLSTHAKKGRYVFEKFGDVRRIMYKDLAEVMELHRSFLEGGLFYILNERVVRINGLEDVYSKLLNDKLIEKMISGEIESSQALELFKSATKKQQSVIVDLLISKLLKDQRVDMQFVYDVERVTSIDITQKVKEGKDFSEIHRIKE